MSNLKINMTRHYKPTLLSHQLLALVTLPFQVNLLPPHNIPSVLSLDLNISKGASVELATEYFRMIRNNNQVKDKYKAIINKGKKF